MDIPTKIEIENIFIENKCISIEMFEFFRYRKFCHLPEKSSFFLQFKSLFKKKHTNFKINME